MIPQFLCLLRMHVPAACSHSAVWGPARNIRFGSPLEIYVLRSGGLGVRSKYVFWNPGPGVFDPLEIRVQSGCSSAPTHIRVRPDPSESSQQSLDREVPEARCGSSIRGWSGTKITPGFGGGPGASRIASATLRLPACHLSTPSQLYPRTKGCARALRRARSSQWTERYRKPAAAVAISARR